MVIQEHWLEVDLPLDRTLLVLVVDLLLAKHHFLLLEDEPASQILQHLGLAQLGIICDVLRGPMNVLGEVPKKVAVFHDVVGLVFGLFGRSDATAVSGVKETLCGPALGQEVELDLGLAAAFLGERLWKTVFGLLGRLSLLENRAGLLRVLEVGGNVHVVLKVLMGGKHEQEVGWLWNRSSSVDAQVMMTVRSVQFSSVGGGGVHTKQAFK